MESPKRPDSVTGKIFHFYRAVLDHALGDDAPIRVPIAQDVSRILKEDGTPREQQSGRSSKNQSTDSQG